MGLTPKYTNKYVNIFLGSVNCPITPIAITYVCVFLDACPFGDPPNYTKKIIKKLPNYHILGSPFKLPNYHILGSPFKLPKYHILGSPFPILSAHLKSYNPAQPAQAAVLSAPLAVYCCVLPTIPNVTTPPKCSSHSLLPPPSSCRAACLAYNQLLPGRHQGAQQLNSSRRHGGLSRFSRLPSPQREFH